MTRCLVVFIDDAAGRAKVQTKLMDAGVNVIEMPAALVNGADALRKQLGEVLSWAEGSYMRQWSATGEDPDPDDTALIKAAQLVYKSTQSE